MVRRSASEVVAADVAWVLVAADVAWVLASAVAAGWFSPGGALAVAGVATTVAAFALAQARCAGRPGQP